jgi:hypothetical protein
VPAVKSFSFVLRIVNCSVIDSRTEMDDGSINCKICLRVFAAGETLSHLQHLIAQGRVEQIEGAVVRYRTR